jgi:adhesin/invasin
MILSVFGSQLSPSTLSASSVPLPVAIGGIAAAVNGVAAPLYYVSPTQLNIQVPYQTAVNASATLTINNNGLVTSRTFPVSDASPGIFVDQTTQTIVPRGSAARGQTTTLYLGGAGAVTPQIATGYAPASSTPLASLPAPQIISVTVGGVVASTTFVGIPYGLVGVTQINFQIPGEAPIGRQAVVVTINGTVSTPAYVNITN